MFDLIERLRKKPDGDKKKFAFFVSLPTAVMIFIVWISVIYPDLSFKERQRETANANDTGVFSSFFTNIQEGISGMKSHLNSVKEAVSSIATSTHYSVSNDSVQITNRDSDNEVDNTNSAVELIQISTTTQDTDPNL